MQNSVLVKEIFTSIQGEGSFVGYNQLFIRFSNCNLNCNYCDTDFKTDLKEYTKEELVKIVNETKNIHSVSLTGGEPLTETDFLIEFLPLLHKKIYLETNGTLPQNLNKIINFIDIISMDIKLNSTTKSGDFFIVHEKFIEIAINAKKEIFLKTVFDENITDEEINKTVELANKYNIELILQPKMNGYFLSLTTSKINEIYEKFNNICKKTRLIPQTHKFLNIQ